MRLSLSLLVLFGLLAASPLPASPAQGADPCPGGSEPAVRARYLMGTVLEVRLWVSPDESSASALAEAVFSEVSRIERVASTWTDDSELFRLQERACGPQLSETLADLLSEAFRFHRATAGAFHPALGSLVAAYDLRGEGRWPTDLELAEALEATRLDTVRLDPVARRLVRRDPRLKFDLDGIAKGWALDRAAEILRREGVRTALLNFGGQVLAIGPPEPCAPFSIRIAVPGSLTSFPEDLPLRDGSISTSSNSERARILAGRKAGHLLDPQTGRFAPFEGSVSVRARTAAAADALSTALFVCGPEPVPSCLSDEMRREEDVEAVYLIPEGGGSSVPRTPEGSPAPNPSRALPGSQSRG